jgi:hypothetical protein
VGDGISARLATRRNLGRGDLLAISFCLSHLRAEVSGDDHAGQRLLCSLGLRRRVVPPGRRGIAMTQNLRHNVQRLLLLVESDGGPSAAHGVWRH